MAVYDNDNVENRDIAWQFWKMKGVDYIHRIGMLANAGHESLGFNPTAVGGNGAWYGLFQWDTTRMPVDQRSRYPDVMSQLEYQWNEGGYEHEMFQEYLNTSYNTPEEAARGFAELVERPNPSTYGYREERARAYANDLYLPDGTEPQTGFTGSIMDTVFTPAAQQMGGGYFDANQDPERAFYGSPNTDMGYLQGLVTNFIDSELEAGGILNTAINMWGLAAHSDSFLQKPLTQDDEKYIKTALAGDKDSQEFVMLFANDSEHAKWLVQQKLEEKQRKAKLEDWKDGNHNILARVGMGVAGAAGYLLDPINLVPTLGAFSKVRLATRLGDGLLNVTKAERIGNFSAREMMEGTMLRANSEVTIPASRYLTGYRVTNDVPLNIVERATLRAQGKWKLTDAERQNITRVLGNDVKNNDNISLPINFLEAQVEKTLATPKGTQTLSKATYRTEQVAEETTGKTVDTLTHAVDVGLNAAGVEMLNRQLIEANTGRKQDYGTTAAVAFIIGSVLGGLGRAVSSSRAVRDVQAKVDTAETRVYADAAGQVSPVAKMRKPTQEEAERMYKALTDIHDTTLAENLYKESQFLQKGITGNLKAVAVTTYDKAADMLKKASGMDLPKSAKAFYVPSIKSLVLMADKLKAGETDKIVAHELVHANLKELLSDKAYKALMKSIETLRKKEGNDFHVASKRYGTTDPEEIIAYVLQDSSLHIPKSVMSKHLRGAVNKILGDEGIDYRYDDATFEELLRRGAREQKTLQETGEHSNPVETVKEDEETGEFVPFADIQFSKESVGNAENFAQFGTSEVPVQDITNADLKLSPFKWLGKKLEGGYIGEAMESLSPTFRKVFSHLFEDARQRGLYKSDMSIPADTNMLRIMHRLNIYLYNGISPLETKWMGKLTLNKSAADKQWWQMVCNAYNAKYAGHSSTVIKDVPEEVNKAVEVLEKFFKEEEELGRKSADDVGSSADNMIERDWYAVDHEMPRISNDALKAKFVRDNYVHSQEKTALEQAKEDIKSYILKAAKRRGDPNDPLRQNSIEGQILRTKKMQNAKADRWNEEHKGDNNFKPKAKVEEVVSDEEIQKYIDDHIDDTVEAWLGDHTFDPAIIKRSETLGNVPWFKRRIPVDTSYVMKLKNSGREFSFDNNLRSYNYNEYFRRRIRRFAGEIAAKNEFKNAYGLEKIRAQIKTELNRAVEDGRLDTTERDSQLRNFDRGVAELRGHAEAEDIATGKAQVLGRIARNWSYFKNGANMGLNQLAEVAGSVAYGGVSQMFSFCKPLQQLVDTVRLGGKSSKLLDELEFEQFGTSTEYQLFPHMYQDSVARNALTRDTILNNGLITASEITQGLSKITSLLNMLPKTTEWMTRSIRKQTIIDTLRWAKGENVGLLRNPFSKAKMKAARISESEAQEIKNALNKYAVYDKQGHLVNFKVNEWKKADMNSYLNWYNMIMLQSERAITPAYRLGNKNLFMHNHGIVPQIMMQFKDYTLRSMNAQTMRVLGARDLDDFLFAGMSVITNTAVYLGRKALEISLLYAAGQTAAAQLKEKNAFSEENIKRAVATRSTVIGSPLSFLNDAYELITGAESVRTTVQRKASSKTGKDRMVGDMAKDAVEQIPAVSAFIDPLTAGAYAVGRMASGNMKSKDLVNLLLLIPLPNWIPFVPLNTYIKDLGK